MSVEVNATDDALLLARLNEPVHSWHHRHYPSRFKPYHAPSVTAFFSNILQRDHVKCLIATYNRVPAGYIVTMIEHKKENEFSYDSRSLYIDQIGVLPEFRKKGIGAALLQSALKWAKTNGIDQVFLDHWSENEEAGKFFTKMGFRTNRLQLKKDL